MSKIRFLCTSRAMALRKLAARTRLAQLLRRRSEAEFSRAELSLRWYSLATCLAGFVRSLFRRRLSIPKSRNLTAAIQFELKRIPFHLESNVTQTRNASGTSARPGSGSLSPRRRDLCPRPPHATEEVPSETLRSEERRVGKEGRSRWA